MTRPEFELLDEYFHRLYDNVGIDQEFLRRVRDHIELCEHIAEADEDKSRIVRTVHWWRKRAALFGLDMPGRVLVPVPRDRNFNASDRRFLYSLRIAADGFSEDESA